MTGIMYSAVILGGGKSSRMNADKKLIDWFGQPLLQHMIAGFSGCEDLLVSTRDGTSPVGVGRARCVADVFPGCGPISGVHAALNVMENDVLFVVSCDAPLVDHRTADLLNAHLDGYDAVVPVDSEGRVHPLAALYHRRIQDPVTELLKQGEFRMRSLLEQVNVLYVRGEKLPYGDLTLANLNTPEDAEHLIKQLERTW